MTPSVFRAVATCVVPEAGGLDAAQWDEMAAIVARAVAGEDGRSTDHEHHVGSSHAHTSETGPWLRRTSTTRGPWLIKTIVRWLNRRAVYVPWPCVVEVREDRIVVDSRPDGFEHCTV